MHTANITKHNNVTTTILKLISFWLDQQNYREDYSIRLIYSIHYVLYRYIFDYNHDCKTSIADLRHKVN